MHMLEQELKQKSSLLWLTFKSGKALNEWLFVTDLSSLFSYLLSSTLHLPAL